MVRCEEFYKYFEKNGNFCNKSDNIVKKVEEYIAYIKRHRIGTYKISNSALDPFICIEFLNDGIVHRRAVSELKKLLKKGAVFPEKMTRRMSIEIINKANNNVSDAYKLSHIPGIRKKMGENEHEINEISFENHNLFEALKKDIGIKNNNQTLKIMIEYCIRNPDEIRKIKEEIENNEQINEEDQNIELISTT